MSGSGTAPGLGGGGATLPKRFYAAATVGEQGDGFALLLDGRGAKTPAKAPLVLPTRAAAEALAAEWSSVEREIDPRLMPFTRLTNSVIDGVRRAEPEVRAEITNYAASDLLLYRAADPQELAERQQVAWSPLVDWVGRTLDAPLTATAGVMHVAQPASSLARIGAAVADLCGRGTAAPFRLGALHVMTTLTGSAILALAVAKAEITPEQAWTLAHVDEDYQIGLWGEDEEAQLRRANRWVEMRTAASLFAMCA